MTGRITPLAIVAALLLAIARFAEAADSGASDHILTLSADLQRQVAVQPAVREPLEGEIDATAMIEPDANAVAHITTRIPGRVVRLEVQLGEAVKAGQSLVILNSVQLGEAKTEYLNSQTLQQIAKQHLDREETLYVQKISPQKDVLQARADYNTALARYRTARETLRLLIPSSDIDRLSWSQSGSPLSEFALTTPIDGTVVKRDVTIGSIIDASHEPLTVIDLDQVWVVANVFEHDLAQLRAGSEALIMVDALPDQHFAGKVTYIADTVDPRTRAVQARIEVPNPHHLLKLGMFAHARIASTVGAREALGVPVDALFDVGGKKIVFVALGGGRYQPREVQAGRTGVDMVEVIAGVKAGDQVVTRGGLLLKALMLNRGE